MTRAEIVEELARNKAVEGLVCRICKTPLTFDLRDLCQMVYLILLEYDEDKIVELYDNNELQFFVNRIIRNNVQSKTSRYYYIIRQFSDITDELDTTPRDDP